MLKYGGLSERVNEFLSQHSLPGRRLHTLSGTLPHSGHITLSGTRAESQAEL